MPAANRTAIIAQPINKGFRELEGWAGAAAAVIGAGGWAGVTEACSFWPQVPQNGPETGEPQLEQ